MYGAGSFPTVQVGIGRKVRSAFSPSKTFSCTGPSDSRRGGMGQFRFTPFFGHVFELAFEGKTIDRPGCPKHAGNHGNLKALYPLEEERGALSLRYAFKDCPGDSSDLPIFVDRIGNPVELA